MRHHHGGIRLTTTVSLLVPGLAAQFSGLAADAYPRLPALSRWLGRARTAPLPADYAEQAAWLLLSGGQTDAAPVAGFSYQHDFGHWPRQHCLRADPVHLRADTNGLILFDSAVIDLDRDESRALVAALADHLALDGIQLVSAASGRWFVLADSEQRLRSTPLPLLRGTRSSADAIAGKDAAVWRQRINELEMLLHAHPVNQARVDAGRMPANSVYLWGGDATEPSGDSPYTAVAGDDPFVAGFARSRELVVIDAGNAAGLMNTAAPNTSVLVILDDCRTAAAYEDFQAYTAALIALEDAWFKPLLELLSRGRIDRLDLVPVNGYRYHLDRRSSWQFWKRRVDYRVTGDFLSGSAVRV